MNKKSLLKKMSIVVASAAMMVTALPLTASAYTGFVNGSYPVNANLYVPQDETPLRKFNAYFTIQIVWAAGIETNGGGWLVNCGYNK